MKECFKCNRKVEDNEMTYSGKCKSCKKHDDDDDDSQKQVNDAAMNAALVCVISAACS